MRCAIVSDYYKAESTKTHEQVQRNSEENSVLPTGLQEFDQKPIHPSLKKLIGKKPVNYAEILQSKRTTRNSAQGATNILCEKSKTILSKPKVAINLPLKNVVCDQTSDVSQLTSARGRNQLKHTLVVGNTSQYIHEQPSSSSITHKWMCYVKTKSAIPIERLVKKVIFHLDPSYKPNDVVDVHTPPFQITKRGYGEFVIKLLIHFIDDVDLKPVQIFHQLSLDKSCSGHQVLGNETVSELWTANNLSDTTSKSEEIQLPTHLVDHDYCRDMSDDTQSTKAAQSGTKQTKIMTTEELVNRLTPLESKVSEWIKNVSTSSSDLLFEVIDVDETEAKEIQVKDFDFHVDDCVEFKFIKMTCQRIGISLTNASSLLVLAAALKSFVKALLKNANSRSEINDALFLEANDIRNSIKLRDNLDFLYELL